MLKNIDSAARAQFLKLFAWIFFPLSVIGYLIGGIIGVIVVGILSVFFSFVGMAFSDKVGSVGAGILSGNILNRGGGSLREQLAPELQRVKYYKGQKQFDQALKIVNGILEKDMVYAEALYIKAIILRDGFGDSTAAKGCLRRIMEMEPVENEMIRRWAASLYDELSEIQVSN